MVSRVLMERYLKMQTLHTITLNAMTAESKRFDVEMPGDQVAGNAVQFDRNVAEAVAGELSTLH